MKAFVLLSGGIDSSVCLEVAYREFNEVEAVSILYGQRHLKEISYAEQQCDRLGVPLQIIDMSSLVPLSPLTDPHAKLPSVGYSDLPGVSPVYVPFRNGLMLSVVTAFAYQRLSDEGGSIVYGAHKQGVPPSYPDCTPEFIGAMANAIATGTNNRLHLYTPLEWQAKPAIIKRGWLMGVPFADTWSCYNDGDRHCGVCPTCRVRKAGFIIADVPDPTEYADERECW